MKDDFKVDFIGIGAPRCATTWISRCLAEHPQICFSQPKETHFFNKDHNYNRGIEYYKTFFKNYKEGQVRGEFSPFYYLSEDAAKRVKEHNSNVKLIVSLRNPIDRMMSAYAYRVKKGREKPKSFIKAIEREPGYYENGKYYKYISMYLKHFGRENIFIMINEEMFADPDRYIKEIYDFIGVDPDYKPLTLNKKVNTTKGTNYYFLLLNRMTDARKQIKKNLLGQRVIRILKLFGLNGVLKFMLKLNRRKKEKETKIQIIEDFDRERIAEYYKEENHKLEKLLNKKINWK